ANAGGLDSADCRRPVLETVYRHSSSLAIQATLRFAREHIRYHGCARRTLRRLTATLASHLPRLSRRTETTTFRIPHSVIQNPLPLFPLVPVSYSTRRRFGPVAGDCSALCIGGLPLGLVSTGCFQPWSRCSFPMVRSRSIPTDQLLTT